MVPVSDFILCSTFSSTTASNITYKKFAIMEIQCICLNFDDILLERICLKMASRVKKECGENLNVLTYIRYDRQWCSRKIKSGGTHA